MDNIFRKKVKFKTEAANENWNWHFLIKIVEKEIYSLAETEATYIIENETNFASIKIRL